MIRTGHKVTGRLFRGNRSEFPFDGHTGREREPEQRQDTDGSHADQGRTSEESVRVAIDDASIHVVHPVLEAGHEIVGRLRFGQLVEKLKPAAHDAIVTTAVGAAPDMLAELGLPGRAEEPIPIVRVSVENRHALHSLFFASRVLSAPRRSAATPNLLATCYYAPRRSEFRP